MAKKRFIVNLVLIISSTITFTYLFFQSFKINNFLLKSEEDKKTLKIGEIKFTPTIATPAELSPTFDPLNSSSKENNLNNSHINRLSEDSDLSIEQSNSPDIPGNALSTSESQFSSFITVSPFAAYSTPQIIIAEAKISTESSEVIFKPKNEKFLYYSQIGNRFPLSRGRGGCTIHDAGCGPTTVAMIISNLKNKVTPEEVVNHFFQKGYYIGCKGTYYDANIKTLESFEIRTEPYQAKKERDYIQIDENTKNDIRQYIRAGVTLFALANFQGKERPIGHYFWIVGIDKEGNFLTLDPYYAFDRRTKSFLVPLNMKNTRLVGFRHLTLVFPN
ncbi:MAG: C39 family peptidase [Patescibacteria group bacterium]|nr:C39 family peptidase [Patescibacteria group bacterium]